VSGKRFLPREHGAYAELLFPVASGLVLGHPGFVAFGLAAAAMFLFLANEPLLVALGVRGARLRTELGAAARRHFAVLTAVAAACGITALSLAPPAVRTLALVPMALGVLLVPFVLAKRLKTLSGELLAVAAFASLHLPLGAAGGLGGVALWGPVAVWLASFASGTLAVHAIKARQQRRDAALVRGARAFSIAATLAAAAIAMAANELRWLGVAALVPCAAVVAVNFVPIRTKSLKTLGWLLVAANLAALCVLALAY
jgi:hypothetical protein